VPWPVTLYGRLTTVYRKVPEPARRWTIEHMPGPLLSVRQRLLARLERRAERHELYDDWYYDNVVDPLMQQSAEAIALSLDRELGPRSAIDVGCGTGVLLLALEQRGVRCLGFDAADAALDRCRQRGLAVRRLDIEREAIPPERADLVVSTEVAEHVPEPAADRFVDLLVALAPVAVLTAAPPGSSGKDHVNEQPNEYWIAKFQARDRAYDRELTLRLRAEWRTAGVDEAFFGSLMVFRHKADERSKFGARAQVADASGDD
jgi:SAM-dependent methyltransferase